MNDLLQYSGRFSGGVVRRPYPTHIDIELDQPLLGVKLVRIAKEHWPEERTGREHWEAGDRVESLFVYDISTALRRLAMRGEASHGFGSILWGDPALNPWNPAHPAHPRKGQVVSGTVYQHAGDNSAIVRVGSELLEAFLHLRKVPEGRFKTLTILLPPGLELNAVIIDVDTMRCKVELSVLGWLEDVERLQSKGRHLTSGARPSPTTPYVQFIDLPSERQFASSVFPESIVRAEESSATRWRGKGVIVIDDDKEFRRNLVGWLEAFGAAAWESDNAQRTAQLLELHASAVTHVLVDFHLGSLEAVNSVIRLLLRRVGGRRTAVISGMVDQKIADGMERLRQLKGANGQDLPLIPKPLHFQVIDDWLLQGIVPKIDVSLFMPAPHWAHDNGPVTQDIRLRGAHWLKAVCHQCEALAAMWVRCHQPGHDVVAMHGVLREEPAESQAGVLRSVVAQMSQSLVGDVESTRSPAYEDRGRAGTLGRLCPPGAVHITALPLQDRDSVGGAVSDRQVSDVLVVFSSLRIDDSLFATEAWTALLDWWVDLAELERHQDRLMEDSIFATVGRVHAATLHEVRSLLQVFQTTKPWTAEVAQAWWQNGQRVSRFVDGGLYNIRPERIAQVNLAHRLEALMSGHVWQFAARRFVTVVVSLPPSDLTVTLPPEVFEQPLINLIDNATKSCQHRRWAWVEVHILISYVDLRRPLVLRVTDLGQGMTPQERRHLFRPRHTQQGAGGFGMGLYVSQRLARAAGGELVLVKNRRWGGCTFELRLPLAWGGGTSAKGAT